MFSLLNAITIVKSIPILTLAAIACRGVLSVKFFFVRDSFVEEDFYSSMCSVACVSLLELSFEVH